MAHRNGGRPLGGVEVPLLLLLPATSIVFITYFSVRKSFGFSVGKFIKPGLPYHYSGLKKETFKYMFSNT
jgi:hypothetical protein